MPNHVHGIISINKSTDDRTVGRDYGRGVGAQNIAPLPSSVSSRPSNSSTNSNTKNQFGPQSKDLASIIRGFKIGVTKNARLIHPDFAWQPRYHDHIIRDKPSFQRISEYIVNNPTKWQEDRFFH